MDRLNYEPKNLTEEDKANILEMLYGPYRDEWRDKNGIVENSDPVIAKRLGLNPVAVTAFTNYDAQNRILRINQTHSSG